MATSSLQSVGSGFAQNGTQTATANKQLDMNAFLRMFTTQLKYQDPTNPLESYELAAQLAQFSSVEKLNEINTNIQAEQALLSSVNNAQMVDLVGKEVIGLDNSIQLKEGQLSKGYYKVGVQADVTVSIYDDKDQLVRTMKVGKVEPGQYEVNWDMRDDAGKTLPDGNYRFDVQAEDAEKNSVDVTKTISGRVFSFRIEEGVPYLMLNGVSGVKLPISAVMEVQQAA